MKIRVLIILAIAAILSNFMPQCAPSIKEEYLKKKQQRYIKPSTHESVPQETSE